MTRFRVTCRCRQCGTVYKRIIRSETAADPKCPNRACRAVERTFGMDMDRPPPAVGGSVVVRAVDYTAETTMQDHGLTDLKDNLRPGETMAPKLAPALERQVDSFWGGGAQQGRNAVVVGRAVQAAMSGQLMDRNNVLQQTHKVGVRPKVHIVAGDR